MLRKCKLLLTAAALSTAASLLLASLTSLTSAQDHNTGYAFLAGTPSPVGVGILTPAGSIRTLVPTKAMGSPYAIRRGCMDYDNRGHILTYQLPSALIRVDAAGRLTTLKLFSVPLLSAAGGVMVNQDGDYTVTMGPGKGQATGAVLNVSRLTGAITTLSILPGSVNSTSLTRDVETGDLYVLVDSNDLIYRIDPSARTITSIAALGPRISLAPHSDIEQDPRSGNLFAAKYPRGVHVVTPSGKTSLHLSGIPFSSTAPLIMDRTSSPNPRLLGLAAGIPQVGNLVYGVGLDGSGFAVISTHAALDWAVDIYVHRGRNVSTILRGNRQWEVALSFPGHGGLGYIVAFGLSGTRPGFMVGRRRVALNPDVLTALSVQDRLAPVVTHTRGLLDPTGRGTAWIQARNLPLLNGLRLYLVAVVLDPKAPMYIRTISDPHMIRIP